MKTILPFTVISLAFLSFASCQNSKSPEAAPVTENSLPDTALPNANPSPDAAVTPSNPSPETAVTSANTSANQTSTQASSSKKSAETQGTVRFSVSFYSAGEGIDTKTQSEFEKFLTTYPKKIAFEPTHYGREGETDYNLTLNELSPSEQKEFIKKAKEVLKNSNRVHINENPAPTSKH